MRFGPDKRKPPSKSGFLYRSRIVDERFTEIIQKPLPFENCAYELRISGTVSTDKRIMSFVNIMWGFEVTGGIDQHEPLTIINVDKKGMAYRAGIRTGDVIERINNTYASGLRLSEAQELIFKSKRQVRIYLSGDTEIEAATEYTVDFYYKPPFRFPPIHVENRWGDDYAWHDRKRKQYRESNCYMVPSKNEEKAFLHDQRAKEEHIINMMNESNYNRPITSSVSAENATTAPTIKVEAEEEFVSILDNRPVIIPTESDDNVTATHISRGSSPSPIVLNEQTSTDGAQ